MYYKRGDYNAICDSCGMKRKGSTLKKRWDGFFVCPPCWNPRHPQDFVVGIPDDQSVPIARPDTPTPTYETTVFSLASRFDKVVQLAAANGLLENDYIGIVMDNGAMHWTNITADTTDDSVTLFDIMPHNASAGNSVIIQRSVSETFDYLLTASGDYLLTASGDRIYI
jgi:hypothetical protein